MKSRVASVGIAVLAAAVLVAALGHVLGWFSPLPSSPEALFARLCEYQLAGETGRMWDLLTEDARDDNRRGFAAHRKVIQQDPNEKLTSQYNCTREEFLRMSDVQIYCSENRGKERALVGAEIVGRTDDKSSNEAYLDISTPSGVRLTLRARHEDGGWRWVSMRPRMMR